MARSAKKAFHLARLVGVALAAVSALAAAPDPARELRVCADPNNFPFSNDQLEGFENKIAEIVAKDIDASARYTWYPQLSGFIRQTLKAGKCDVVIGVPNGYEPVLCTKPYYTSSYVFVYAKNSNLNLHSFDDPMLRKIKIGLHTFGDDGANAPPAHALARRGIVGNIIGFRILHTADSPPGKIIDAVAAREIDVAIVWGPFAGYFAKQRELEVTPVSPSVERAYLPFIYEVSMGVRLGDTALKQQLEGVLERRRDEIQKVLETYGVPLINGGASISPSAKSKQPARQSRDVKER